MISTTQVTGSTPRWKSSMLLAAMMVCAAAPVSAESNLAVNGFAWTQSQSGLRPMYAGAGNFDNNLFFQAGGMVFLNSKPSENWTTNLSVGVAFENSAIKGSIRDSNNALISKTNPNSISLGMGGFLYEANIDFHIGTYALKIGKFHYRYSDYNHNMGLYLLRGPVYPGFLYSGFNQIEGITKTGILSSWGPSEAFRWDILGSFETDFKPYMDLNLSTFLTFKAGPVELGTGIEAQRLVEFNPCTTSPKDGNDLNECLGGDPGSSFVGAGNDLYKGAYFVIDTNGVGAGGRADTTTYSLAGYKAMVRAAFDFKSIIGEYQGSKNDFVVYLEAALLGVENYPHLYENRLERVPVLFGINFPTFGLMEALSLELEYYNAPYQNDPYKLVGSYDVFQFAEGNSINYAMSPIPPSNKAGYEHLAKAQEDFDPKQDNLKWSVYAAKTIHEKITFKAQIASDHWRVPNNNFVQYEAAAKPGQFYGSLRVQYSL
jgi:hypothetical protein